MKQFYRYVYDFRSKNANEHFLPSDRMKQRLFSALVKLECDLIPEGKLRDLWPALSEAAKSSETLPAKLEKFRADYGDGDVTVDWRYGFAEYDEELVGLFGWDSAAIAEEVSDAGRDMRLKFLTNEQMVQELRTKTVLTEREPGLFVVSEATEMMGQPVPEKLIDLR